MLTVVLPTLNEVGAIGGLIDGIESSLVGMADFEICVVDDGSTDGTQEAVSAKSREFGNVRLIERPNPDSLPGAIAAGIDSAPGPTVAWLDADGSMPGSVIPRLLNAFYSNGGVVVGSRFVDGGGFKGVTDASRHPFVIWRNLHASNDSLTAVVLSRALNLWLRVVLGQGVKDYTSGFVLGEKSVIQGIGIEGEYGDYCPILLYKLRRQGVQITEIGYINLPRETGESKTGSSLRQYFHRGWPYVTSALKTRLGHRE